MVKEKQIENIQSNIQEQNICETKLKDKNVNQEKENYDIDDYDEKNDTIAFMDWVFWLFPVTRWKIRDWFVKPFKYLFLYGYSMKWIVFLSWFFSNDEETLVSLKEYQIVETDTISVWGINNFRYPAIMLHGERVVSQSFWCFWDAGHLIYCFLMYLLLVLTYYFWKGLKKLFINRLIMYCKRKVLENKRKMMNVSGKRRILKVGGSRRVNKKQKRN
jgi:hypothetical protein